jgi:fluoride ion exporter CrcB/FEX
LVNIYQNLETYNKYEKGAGYSTLSCFHYAEHNFYELDNKASDSVIKTLISVGLGLISVVSGVSVCCNLLV